ncbi:putative alpha-1,6-mannosyltransferase subunit [Talaromyces proteolyticus]|uniref:Alpha-1,6-mannosyltransferase subunit n=1 Tax=Talaromyces proteolyticus TaxID=1131652 RepID=A0AAD4KHS7_9EURO|nr:putative alpha-1,6-mannosyltransferase subunit [Talaromyces proteolyticus]KAH8692026.1 putative alpha-1,6-mannosyltransferase subunit [Talaromyces proteolyticus]
MSLSRSPSPLPGGGWSSPGLTPGSGSSSPRYSPRPYTSQHNNRPPSPGGVSWATAKAKSDQVRSYPSFSTRNSGFFSRQKRKISASLPRFTLTRDYREQEKLNRGRSWESGENTFKGRLFSVIKHSLHKRRFKISLFAILGLILYLSFWSAIVESYRASAFGGGQKVVMLVASNVEGGVMEWKGAREWAIERVSLRNKRKYAQRWGHNVEVLDMVAKKRYAHEWREGWEKVDFIRNAMKKYPNAEWFWWLDLNTFIMEYSYSLDNHILKYLGPYTYRDINYYNPLNITHPLTDIYLDSVTRSPTGDSNPSSINLVLPQDCGGFSLGSFLIRRSDWTDRLLDVWWDPVLYEQKHMEWEHKEQDAFEYLYTNQPWIRPNTAFVPQRRMNSFPPGACGNGSDLGIHYQESQRDFLVNLADCNMRDCWTEIYGYRELSNWLNRNPWEILKDSVTDFFRRLRGKTTLHEEHHMILDVKESA